MGIIGRIRISGCWISSRGLAENPESTVELFLRSIGVCGHKNVRTTRARGKFQWYSSHALTQNQMCQPHNESEI